MFSVELNNIPETPGLYMLINWNNDVIYAGSTTRLRRRIREHLASASPSLVIFPLDIKSVQTLSMPVEMRFVRKAEKKLIRYLADAGSPLRNSMKNFDEAHIDIEMLWNFRTYNVWNGSITERKDLVEHRKSLLSAMKSLSGINYAI